MKENKSEYFNISDQKVGHLDRNKNYRLPLATDIYGPHTKYLVRRETVKIELVQMGREAKNNLAPHTVPQLSAFSLH